MRLQIFFALLLLFASQVRAETVRPNILFLIAGRARVMLYAVSGKAVAFRDIGPGDFFGELAAIDGKPRSASVEALEPCLVACMSASVFREAFRSQPTVTDAVVRHLAGQVRTLTGRVFEFSTLAVRNRIQAELLRLARAAGAVEDRVARIEPAPTHEEIASRISTHRQAVTSELNRLAQIGLIERHGRALEIKDVDQLIRMVHEATGL